MKYIIVALCCLAVVSSASGQFGPGNVVISQLYGGGGNTGATHRNDFVELFNRTTSPISTAGWSIQYASAGGSAWGSNLFALPSASIPSGGYFLVQMASSAAGDGVLLPTPDATSSINMAAGAGKVALVINTTALNNLDQNPSQNASVMDFVGYGPTATGSETSPAPAPSNITSIFRFAGGLVDLNNNSTDFFTGTPDPRNSSSPHNPVPEPATVLGLAAAGLVAARVVHRRLTPSRPGSACPC